jgi:hypothetical protein
MKSQRFKALAQLKEDLSESAQERFLVTFNEYLNKGCDYGSAVYLAWQALKQNQENT